MSDGETSQPQHEDAERPAPETQSSPSSSPAPPQSPPFSRSISTAPMPRQDTLSRYPVNLGVEVPDRVARWRPVVQWVLTFPLFIILYFVSVVAIICALIGWFVALFTGRLPDGLGNFIAGYYRYAWRIYSYVYFLRTTYPPFAPALGYQDPGGDPAWFEVRSGEGLNRLAVLFRIILVIPQYIVVSFLNIVLQIVVLVALVAVVITGRWPDYLRDFVIGASRWTLRVNAWFLLLADPYPPFSLA